MDINDHQDHIFNRLHDVNTKAAAVYKNDGEEYKKYVSAIDQYFLENDIDKSKFGDKCGVSLKNRNEDAVLILFRKKTKKNRQNNLPPHCMAYFSFFRFHHMAGLREGLASFLN